MRAIAFLFLAVLLISCGSGKPDKAFVASQKEIVSGYLVSKQHGANFRPSFYDSAASQMRDSLFIFIRADLSGMRPIDSANKGSVPYYEEKQARLEGKFNNILSRNH